MKNARYCLILLPLLLLSSFATGQTEKTFVQSFALSGKSVLTLYLGPNVTVQQWDNAHARFQVAVAVGVPESLFKSLVETGRYTPKITIEAESVVVKMPSAANELRINGHVVAEHCQFMVYVPKNVTVQILPCKPEKAPATAMALGAINQ